MSREIDVNSEIRYYDRKEEAKVSEIVKKLRSEGWRVNQPELHNDGLGVHIIYLKRTIKL